MAKDLRAQIDNVIEFIALEPNLTLDEKARGILNFVKKVEAQNNKVTTKLKNKCSTAHKTKTEGQKVRPTLQPPKQKRPFWSYLKLT